MRRATIIILLLALALSSLSCQKKAESQFKEVELYYSYPHPAEQTTFLELGWGNGDNQVGYINDDFRESVEKGLEGSTLGPQNFCIDGEGSIYILDTMNYRILKYDDDSNYSGCFDINRIGSISGGIVPGPDCVYIYQLDHDVIYRYRFQDDELKKLVFSDLGIDFKIGNELHAIYDGLGNSYFSEYAHDPREPLHTYYMVNPEFTAVIGIREVPYRMGLIQYVDDDGTFYVAAMCDPNPDNLALYTVDTSGNVSTVAVYPKDVDDNSEAYLSREPISSPDLIIYNGYYITRDGRLVERIRGAQQKVYRYSRDVKVYWMQRRPYEYDDKSPFRIYRVIVSWDQVIQ